MKDSESKFPNLFYRMYERDTFHPSIIGTYLAACTILGTITGDSPKTFSWLPDLEFNRPWEAKMLKWDSEYVPQSLTEDLAEYLRDVAHRAITSSSL